MTLNNVAAHPRWHAVRRERELNRLRNIHSIRSHARYATGNDGDAYKTVVRINRSDDPYGALSASGNGVLPDFK